MYNGQGNMFEQKAHKALSNKLKPIVILLLY